MLVTLALPPYRLPPASPSADSVNSTATTKVYIDGIDIVAKVAHLEAMCAPAPPPPPTPAPRIYNFAAQIATVDAAPSFYYWDRTLGYVVKLQHASDNGVNFIRAMAQDGYFDNPLLACPDATDTSLPGSDRRYFGFEDHRVDENGNNYRGGNTEADNWMIFHMSAPVSINRVRSRTGRHPGANYHGTLTLYGSNSTNQVTFLSSGRPSGAWTELTTIAETFRSCAMQASVSFTARYTEYLVTLSENNRGTYQHMTAIAFDLA